MESTTSLSPTAIDLSALRDTNHRNRAGGLPFELLAIIFKLVCTPSPDDGEADIAYGLIVRCNRLWISHTCWRWRAITLAIPSLWSAISIRYEIPWLREAGVAKYLAEGCDAPVRDYHGTSTSVSSGDSTSDELSDLAGLEEYLPSSGDSESDCSEYNFDIDATLVRTQYPLIPLCTLEVSRAQHRRLLLQVIVDHQNRIEAAKSFLGMNLRHCEGIAIRLNDQWFDPKLSGWGHFRIIPLPDLHFLSFVSKFSDLPQHMDFHLCRAIGLRHLWIQTRTTIDLALPSSCQITRLHLASCIDTRAFVNIVQCCPQLETLHWSTGDLDLEQFRMLRPFLNLRNLSIESAYIGSSLSRIEAPRLEALSVDDIGVIDDDEGFNDYQAFTLGSEQFPKLRYLALVIPTEDLEQFLRLHPHLEELKLFSNPEDKVMECLMGLQSDLPNLHHLALPLSWSKEEDCRDEFYDVQVVKDILDARCGENQSSLSMPFLVHCLTPTAEDVRTDPALRGLVEKYPMNVKFGGTMQNCVPSDKIWSWGERFGLD